MFVLSAKLFTILGGTMKTLIYGLVLFSSLSTFSATSSTMIEPPQFKIQESNTAYDISAQIPGMDQETIKVKLLGDNLFITGDKTTQSSYVKDGVQRQEATLSEFERMIHLKDSVDPLSLKTTFQNGFMKVHLNKTKTSKKNQL